MMPERVPTAPSMIGGPVGVWLAVGAPLAPVLWPADRCIR